jgi:histidinol-phosphate aminotransferase
VEFIPSQANFVLANVGGGDRFFELMLDEGVIVRSAAAFGMAEWIRVSVGTPEEMAAFEEAFTKVSQKVGL